MDKLLLIHDDKFIQKNYNTLIKIIFIAVAIQYAFFLLVQIIDLFVEGFYFDDEFYMFYYLRFLFFGFSLIIQIAVVISVIVYFISLAMLQDEQANFLDNLIFKTFIKIICAFYGLWSIILFICFIPRITILLMNKDKIGTFISILIYLKMFVMTSIFINVMIMYILNKEKYGENKPKKNNILFKL